MTHEPYIRFDNGTWHRIAGRGLVYATTWPKDGSLEDRKALLGSMVLIDGIPYTVRAIEHFSHGDNIGLVVNTVTV